MRLRSDEETVHSMFRHPVYVGIGTFRTKNILNKFWCDTLYKFRRRSLKIIPEKRFDNSGRAGEI